ncbi:MAG: ATP-grasp domain-containing protein, partial [Oscillospiraceae bacterium]
YKLNPNDKNEVIETAYSYSKLCSRNGDVIVEEFMDGEEISVETLSIDGKCHIIQITDKLTTGTPHFVEMGHSQPTHHSQEMVAKINKITNEANYAVGIKNGPSHTEIIITKEGPKIVELGARLGGDCITTHLVPLSTGVDMVKCCIEIALGETPDIRSKWNKGAAIRYFKQHAGVVNSIEGIDVAKRMVGVNQISIIHNVGEKITEIDSSGSRLGFVIANGENANSAIKICEEVLDMINIEIK